MLCPMLMFVSVSRFGDRLVVELCAEEQCLLKAWGLVDGLLKGSRDSLCE